MLTLTARSEAKKTAGCAVTYRSGVLDRFSTCPVSCPLNPKPSLSTQKIDAAYLEAIRQAVPRRGIAFTFTHFPGVEPSGAGGTVINFSADSISTALLSVRIGPTALAVPSHDRDFPRREQGVRFVRCPAETSQRVTCVNCGGRRPLCARPDRDYVIVFTGHGTRKRLVGTDEPGGCYAELGPAGVQWSRTVVRGRPDGDLLPWAKGLPQGTILRHHVAGDIGLDPFAHLQRLEPAA